ncbi:MAG: DegQ family serine endoprotease [Methylococcales bacterium]|jgi:serine protease Do/serine protease DegQ|nr:DegQ family serine endoprotease [Methylococcales bacterium]
MVALAVHQKYVVSCFILVFLGCLGVLQPVSAALPLAIAGESLPSLAPILDKSMPAVVNISTLKNIRVNDNPLMKDPFFRHFYQQRKQQRQQNSSLGSGVIIDKRIGLVLTNNHVIDQADEILVTLSDKRQFKAKLIGSDPEADVAVIQIPADNLVELPIADSSQLRVGDFVIAIGNPYGLGQTVTSGIVSALGRTGLGIEGYEDFIQTDASINPGNSGGALINLRGELIGINTAILAPNGGNVGIGFAIPSNMAMTLKNALVQYGEVRRGLLGISTQDLTPDLVKAFGISENYGAVISRVQAGSSAERAGLEAGDIIRVVNNLKIENSHQIRNIVGLLQVGDQVDVTILRNGRLKKIQATVGKPASLVIKGRDIHKTLTGVVLSATSKDRAPGVLISQVDSSSYAWQAGLRPGDTILSVNRYRVQTVQDFKKVAGASQRLLLNIQRNRDAFFIVLQ